MSDVTSLDAIYPRRYVPPDRERTYEQHVIVNWLYQELDISAPQRMPILDKLTHWRNREVFVFIKDWWDWTAHIYPQAQR